jgi:23S rRNA pseudouridine955/2504/2580 synthase
MYMQQQLGEKVSHVNVTADAGAGQRIDNFLFTKLKGVPKSKIYNILRKGEVRVNKGRIKPSYKLQADDIIRVPPIKLEQVTTFNVTQKHLDQWQLEETILHEDDDLIILNKPAGLAVHGGSGVSFGLIEAMRALRPAATHLELIHRLDRDTSGCIMIAKSVKMLRAMHELLRDGKVTKIYHTLVKGYVAGDFKVNVPLKKFTLQSGERMVRVNELEGRQSLTEFTLLERYNSLSLLAAKPITGRTHQIRVHAVCRGFPIVGDEKYGNKEFNQALRKLNVKRMYLHARQLMFTCPLTQADMVVSAPYDQNWEAGIQAITRE